MRRIKELKELEAQRQYWVRPKNSKTKEIEMIYCVPWRGSIVMSFYVAEFMGGVLHARHILDNYDIIGPIRPISQEEFQSVFNKD